jgi:hypothetical protein
MAAPLTPEEKAAGRLFLDSCAYLLTKVPSQVPCSPFTVWYRHSCRDDGRGSTWGMRVRQHYWTSPGYPGVQAGLFGFIFRWGRCGRCGLMVRSGTGRFVIAADSPPEKGAVVERKPADRFVPAH